MQTYASREYVFRQQSKSHRDGYIVYRLGGYKITVYYNSTDIERLARWLNHTVDGLHEEYDEHMNIYITYNRNKNQEGYVKNVSVGVEKKREKGRSHCWIQRGMHSRELTLIDSTPKIL